MPKEGRHISRRCRGCCSRCLPPNACVLAQEAYNATRRIFNVTVTSTNPHESPRLLNYLTAPHVVCALWWALVLVWVCGILAAAHFIRTGPCQTALSK